MTAILGISAFYHDSAAALIVDGKLVAAAQEERFTRTKHDASFPEKAVQFCLNQAGITAQQLDYVGFYDKPLLTFERLLESYLAYAPRGFRSFATAMPRWLTEKLYLDRIIRKQLSDSYDKRIVFTEHHESHAASAFFPSPLQRAATLTIDGVGEWATASFGRGEGSNIELIEEMRFPHSLGLLYSAFTYFCGFQINDGEYKLMGLAPYGEPRYADKIRRELVEIYDDGSLSLNMDYFAFVHGLTMTTDKFHVLFDGPPRAPGAPITQREKNLAASIQKVTEEVVVAMARYARDATGERSLCLAGGVALNCVANGVLRRAAVFDEFWIQPAAGDAGGALGTALLISNQLLGTPRRTGQDAQQGSLLGPAYLDSTIETLLKEMRIPFEHQADKAALCRTAAEALQKGQAVAWFQGRMEFGPRALGARSILGNPQDAHMQQRLNLKIKFREGFRPFAPAVLQEDVCRYFSVPAGYASPYMLEVVPVLPEAHLPAVTHVDQSARIQTVDRDRYPLFHRLLTEFKRQSGCSVLVNTSFNLGWEPIVGTPADALKTFMSSELDMLCLGNYVVRKSDQPAEALAADRIDELLRSPCHGAVLQSEQAARRCSECGLSFDKHANEIESLFYREDGQTSDEAVRLATPDKEAASGYETLDTLRSLIDAAHDEPLAVALHRAIPYNSMVLEMGCGTGRLSNYLGTACRTVVGIDTSIAALETAEAFRAAQQLRRVRFLRMDALQPAFRDASFDVVVCNDTLLDAASPRSCLKRVICLLKPGGYVVVGRIAFGAGRFVGPRHTITETLDWFDELDIEFVRGNPPTSPGGSPENVANLFDPSPRGRSWEHAIAELQSAMTNPKGDRVFIGRKPMVEHA